MLFRIDEKATARKFNSDFRVYASSCCCCDLCVAARTAPDLPKYIITILYFSHNARYSVFILYFFSSFPVSAIFSRINYYLNFSGDSIKIVTGCKKNWTNNSRAHTHTEHTSNAIQSEKENKEYQRYRRLLHGTSQATVRIKEISHNQLHPIEIKKKNQKTDFRRTEKTFDFHRIVISAQQFF